MEGCRWRAATGCELEMEILSSDRVLFLEMDHATGPRSRTKIRRCSTNPNEDQTLLYQHQPTQSPCAATISPKADTCTVFYAVS